MHYSLERTLAFLVLTLTFLSYLSCKKHEGFELNGNIEKNAPDFIIVKYGDVKDTVQVVHNKFKLTGKVKFPTRADLLIPPASTVNDVLFIENRKIDITITIDRKDHNGITVNFIRLDSVQGTHASVLKKEYENFLKKNTSRTDFKQKLFQKLNKIVKDNPSHGYSGYLLAETAKKKILDNQKIKSLFLMLDTLNQSTLDLAAIKKTLSPASYIYVGNKILDFTMLDSNDRKISTKDFRGKMLLIDFWASWCVPCRKQNPKLIQLYNKFHGDFNILGVSIDSDKKRWLNAIEKDELPWHNVIEPEGYKSMTLIKYGVTSAIPRNFLVDETGTVLAIDIDIKNLETLLKNKSNDLKSI